VLCCPSFADSRFTFRRLYASSLTITYHLRHDALSRTDVDILILILASVNTRPHGACSAREKATHQDTSKAMVLILSRGLVQYCFHTGSSGLAHFELFEREHTPRLVRRRLIDDKCNLITPLLISFGISEGVGA
jgi:hypothetical protein